MKVRKLCRSESCEGQKALKACSFCTDKSILLEHSVIALWFYLDDDIIDIRSNIDTPAYGKLTEKLIYSCDTCLFCCLNA